MTNIVIVKRIDNGFVVESLASDGSKRYCERMDELLNYLGQVLADPPDDAHSAPPDSTIAAMFAAKWYVIEADGDRIESLPSWVAVGRRSNVYEHSSEEEAQISAKRFAERGQRVWVAKLVWYLRPSFSMEGTEQ